MPGHDIIVIGGSAGALEGLRELAAKFPPAFPAALFAVIHMAEEYPSVLARILNRAGPLPALEAADGDAIQPGRICVACPGRHLVLGK